MPIFEYVFCNCVLMFANFSFLCVLFLPIFHFYVILPFLQHTLHICVVIHKKLAKYAAYTKEYSCVKSCIAIHIVLKIHCIQVNFVYQFFMHFCYTNRVFLPIFHFTAFYICQFSLFLRFYKIMLAFYVSVCYNSLAR